MSGVHPFQFEPTYPPGEEPVDSEEEGDEGDGELANFDVRVGNIEWCICGGNCVPMSTADECFCCQELEALNQKFDESGVECITDHAKFRIVCLDTDVLNTALVAIHNARCNPLPEPIENRTWRLAAYRQFTWWVHGVLGKKKPASDSSVRCESN
ncbi:uncharacterized protein LOC110062885 [Orbicella faveolata]|uniref:uncharacterized protein LOC110062885 n=1 Tax=Orbicella faveolata TaxID=48498 RepID=UPI0009E37B17|nr:uncharacterized protein LOC110062885 [Orbicella faveolata]